MIFNIGITKIRKSYENNIIKEIQKYTDSNINNYDKRILILGKDKTTIYLIQNNAFQNQINNSFSIIYLNNSLLNSIFSNTSQSTFVDSKININFKDSNTSLINFTQDKKLNPARAIFCLKNKLYDIPLTIEYLNYNHPPKYTINDLFYIYLYPNEIHTYCLTISGFMHKKNMVIDSIDKKVNDSEYNLMYGIYFCNKNIEVNVGNKIETKKCSPNNFICSICMKINKEKYKIKNNYLIAINGRIAKKNKGSYHCFGHFLCGNQIEDCIKKYTCKSCKLLNYYSNIYA